MVYPDLALRLRSRARAQSLTEQFRRGECRWCGRERTTIAVNKEHIAKCVDCRNEHFANACRTADRQRAMMQEGDVFVCDGNCYFISNKNGTLLSVGSKDAWEFTSIAGPASCPHCDAALDPLLPPERRRWQVENCQGSHSYVPSSL
jgi:hypothetical protein